MASSSTMQRTRYRSSGSRLSTFTDGATLLKLEVHRIAAMLADHLHAQTRRHGAVLFVAGEVAEAVEDVVHPHDGRGGLGGEQRLCVEVLARFGQQALQELRIARGD